VSRQRRDRRFIQAAHGPETNDQENAKVTDSGPSTDASSICEKHAGKPPVAPTNDHPGPKSYIRPRSKDEHRRPAVTQLGLLLTSDRAHPRPGARSATPTGSRQHWRRQIYHLTSADEVLGKGMADMRRYDRRATGWSRSGGAR